MTLSSWIRSTALACALGAATACHGLLDVSDPTIVQDQDLANAGGANGRRLNAARAFFSSLSFVVAEVGTITDELTFDADISSLTSNDFWSLDRRDSEGYESNHTGGSEGHLGYLDAALTAGSLAIPEIRTYTPPELRGDYLAELFAYRGYVLLQMAEDICPGFPINDITGDNLPLLSGPVTTDSATHLAIVQLDSALADVSDSTQLADFARVMKGRALLDLGQYDSAAAVVHAVTTGFVYASDMSQNNNPFTPSYDAGSHMYSTGLPAGDRQGGNGLAFVTEHDTIRTPMGYAGQRRSFPLDTLYTSLKYPSSSTPFVLASGTEARLIEAEVALHNHDASWLTILNALRTPAGLAALADPGTDGARVDLIYHERAFWLYLTGRRLGDLRRLIRNYERSAESVFPTGIYPLGGTYGTATSIPFSFKSQALYNSKITSGCTTR
jgi:hypothetical protein